MARTDYTWDATTPDMLDVRLTAETMPNRVALTAPQLIMEPTTANLLLVDPHPPGTWDTWMLPYASLILTLAEIQAKAASRGHEDLLFLRLSPGDTLWDLGHALRELRQVFLTEYRAALRESLNNVIPDLNGSWNGTPVYENYSLKFSDTSQSYTAYLFSYYRLDSRVEVTGLPHIWIQPSRIKAKEDAPVHGKKIASNVLDVLPVLEQL
jgi:hypothetical protein